mmetsp:Transcript_119787/g.298841  ORF Transcript_119787/g.298841 Transcript_119787/m.298841 type:complete len:202 (+) Transcript_119787:1063-1668(+)
MVMRPRSSRSKAFQTSLALPPQPFNRLQALKNSGFWMFMLSLSLSATRHARKKQPNFALRYFLNSASSARAWSVSMCLLHRVAIAFFFACSLFIWRLRSAPNHFKLCLISSRSAPASSISDAFNKSSQPPSQPCEVKLSEKLWPSRPKSLSIISSADAKCLPHQIRNLCQIKCCVVSISSSVISPEPSKSRRLNNLLAFPS